MMHTIKKLNKILITYTEWHINHTSIKAQQYSPIKHPIASPLEVLIILSMSIVTVKSIHTASLQIAVDDQFIGEPAEAIITSVSLSKN